MMTRAPRALLGIAGIAGMLLASILVTGSVAQAITIPITGNANTISFYRAVVKVTRLFGGMVIQQTGYASLKSPTGKSWLAFYGQGAPAGYSPTSELITVAASGGKVTWVTDKMTPQCSPSVGSSSASVSCGSNVPVESILDNSGRYATEDFAAYSCWGTNNRYFVGGYTKLGGSSGESLYGHYLPMKRVGRNELVTSTYPWGKATATEIETISRSTHLPSKSALHVTKDGTTPAFTVNQTFSWLKTAPLQPRVTVCAG